MSVTITGTVLDRTGSPVPNAVVTFTPTITPLFELVNGVWSVVEYGPVSTSTTSSGTFSVTLPDQSQCSPSTVQWVLEDPSGNTWSGPLTAAMAGNSYDLYTLTQSHGWGLVKAGNVVGPVVGIQGPAGPAGPVGSVGPTYGTLANRPTVATAGDKALYVATDVNGGTLYQVESGAWMQVTPGVANTALLNAVQTFTQPQSFTAATPVTANSGLVSLGSGPFDGTTAGHFAGSASGTLIAGNAPSGYAGNLLDLQVNGVSKVSIGASGGVSAGGNYFTNYTGTFGTSVQTQQLKPYGLAYLKFIPTSATAATDTFLFTNSAGTTGSQFDAVGRLGAPGVAAPTVAAGAAVGTTPPAPTITGSDQRGSVSLGTGTATAAGTLATVTFNAAWGTTPFVVLTAMGAATQALGLYVTGTSATGFSIAAANAPAVSQAAGTYNVTYMVLG